MSTRPQVILAHQNFKCSIYIHRTVRFRQALEKSGNFFYNQLYLNLFIGDSEPWTDLAKEGAVDYLGILHLYLYSVFRLFCKIRHTTYHINFKPYLTHL